MELEGKALEEVPEAVRLVSSRWSSNLGDQYLDVHSAARVVHLGTDARASTAYMMLRFLGTLPLARCSVFVCIFPFNICI
jgi:hypothetical protein